MTAKGNATKAMLNLMAKDTFHKAKEWFETYPDEPFCYWGKDHDFLPASATEQQKQDFMKRHPEIEDLNDHTIVQFDEFTQALYLSKFCPRLREGLRDILESGINSNTVDGFRWRIIPDEGNFRVVCYEED